MYFDINKKKPIHLDKDCTSINEWMKSTNNAYSCASDPDGFLIFIKPNNIDAFNEYKEGDPYKVLINLESKFQKRRFQSTLKLLYSLDNTYKLKILDLGCGEGHLTHEIFNSFPESEIFGLDYSISAIKTANKIYTNIHFVVADGYEPPFVDNYFDVVILNNIWEHVPDPLRMLNGVKRILRKNGAIIISTPSRYRFSNLIRILRGKRIIHMSKLHVTEYTVGQIVEQLDFSGFKISKVYSETIKENRFFVHLIKMFISFFLRAIGSHHVLESTVFYLGVKK